MSDSRGYEGPISKRAGSQLNRGSQPKPEPVGV
jgi:hypothetical protein